MGMTVEVELVGNGSYAGARAALTDYSVTEEITPIDPADASGAVPEITFTAVDNPDRYGSMLLHGTGVKLTDTDNGTVTGTIASMNATDKLVTVTAVSRLGELVSVVDADPFTGTLSAAITYYLGLVGITTDISVDASLASKTVTAPGWREQDLWTKIKELCTVYGAEVVMVGNVITVRPIRSKILTPKNAVNESWSVDSGTPSRSIQVAYYNSEYKTNYTIYPDNGIWNEDMTVLSVDAEETTTTNIPVDMFLASVEQPTPIDLVLANYTGPSVYSVAGADGFTIAAQAWLDYGGKLTVAVGEDGRSLDVTITGAGGDIAQYAPFRIAAPAMDGAYYSSLRIRATGVYYREEFITSYTGADNTRGSEIGITVQNQFVRTRADAWKLAAKVARRYVGGVAVVSRTDSTAKPDSGTVLGGVVGSRFKYRRAYYRVKSTTVKPSGVDYTGEADTTFADFNNEAAGMTFADFNAMYAGMTFGDFSMSPLPKPDLDNDRH